MRRLLPLILFGIAISATAQTLDSPVAYPVVVSAAVTQQPHDHPQYLALGVSDASVGCIPALRSSSTAKMIPGKNYTFSGSVAQTEGFKVDFIAPAGFRLYVNGQLATSFSYTCPNPYPEQYSTPLGFSGTVRLEFFGAGQRLPDSPAGLSAGQATSIVDDKPIWYVGLGLTRTGAYAGAVGFRRASISGTDFFTPAALYYEPIDSTEVSVIRVSNVLRQIFAREVLVDIQALTSTSYRMAVYPRSQVGALSGGVYAVSGSPFVTYTVSKISQSGVIGVRIDRVEDGQTTWTSLQQVGQAMEQRDWRRSSATVDSYTRTNFTSSTAATVSLTGPSANGSVLETPLTWTKTYVDYTSYDSTWGKELTQTCCGPSEVVPLITQYAYYTATDSAGGYIRQLKLIIKPDGSWSKYLYFGSAMANGTTASVQRIYEPWLDGPSSPDSATTSNSKYTDWTYKNVTGVGGWVPLTSETHAPGGATLAKTAWTYTADTNALNGHSTYSTTCDSYASSGSKVTSISRSISATDANSYYQSRAISQSASDGHKDSYAYFPGTWNATTRVFTASSAGSDRLQLIFHGQQTAGTQPPAGTSVSSWAISGVTWNLDPLYMVANRSTVSESVVDTTGRTVLFSEDVYTGAGALERISGTQYRYDTHGRLTELVDVVRSVGVNEVKTVRTYNGPLLATEATPDGTVTTYDYDDFLRLIQKTEGLGGPSTYPAKIKQTKYDGANRPAQTYTCSCGTTFTSLYYDTAGRLESKMEASPNSGGSLVTSYDYQTPRRTLTICSNNATRLDESFLDGRAKSITGTAQAPVYYEYSLNATGLLTRTGHRAPTGSTAGQTLGWTEVQQDWLGRKVTSSTPTWQWAGNNNIVDVNYTYNTVGQLTRERTTYRSTGNKLLPDKLYLYRGDGSVQRAGLDVNEDGALTDVSNDRINDCDVYFSKDSWGWTKIQSVTTAPETGGGLSVETSHVVTRLTGFNAGSQPSSGVWVVSDTTSFDASGRSTAVWEYVNPSGKTRWVSQTVSGASQSGTTTWINGYASTSISTTGARKAQDYDSKGRLANQYSNYNGTSYSTTTAYAYYGDTQYVNTITTGGITTTYAYGWATASGAREVIVTDGAGKVTHTAYNAMDLPARTWGNGAAPSEIGYDSLGRRTNLSTWRSGDFTGTNWPGSGSADTTLWTLEPSTGLLQGKTYADGRQLSYTYNPLGQLATRTNARSQVTTYAYYDGATTATSDVSHRTGELRAVTYSDTTPALSYVYKRSGLPYQIGDFTGTRTFAYRASDMQLDSETLPSGFYGANRVLQATYDANATWRNTGFQLKNNGAVEAQALASFDPTTGRVSTLAGAGTTFTLGYRTNTDWVQTLTAGSYVQTRTLLASRGVLQEIATTWNGAVLGDYSSTFDARGLLQTQTYGGTIGGGRTNTYSYDDRGQLTTSTNNLAANRNFAWGFDLAGNRTTANNNGARTSYGSGVAGGSANNVNQYPSITGTLAETGLHYDAEGNMDTDGTWTCSFDAENRLAQMVRKDGTLTLQFAYDYMGRRVKKTVRNGGAASAIASSRKFVWQGWKLVVELDAATTESGASYAKGYLWGPDISNGAGAGGLLAVQQGGATYYPVYDLQGNATGYVDAAGTIVASYEYNAFGQIVACSGSYTAFPLGFSTQCTDYESGWLYYGMRFYTPRQGRFVNRDPIEEQGGANLYAFCGNSGVNGWDVLGLECHTVMIRNGGNGEASEPRVVCDDDGTVVLPPITVTASNNDSDIIIHNIQQEQTISDIVKEQLNGQININLQGYAIQLQKSLLARFDKAVAPNNPPKVDIIKPRCDQIRKEMSSLNQITNWQRQTVSGLRDDVVGLTAISLTFQGAKRFAMVAPGTLAASNVIRAAIAGRVAVNGLNAGYAAVENRGALLDLRNGLIQTGAVSSAENTAHAAAETTAAFSAERALGQYGSDWADMMEENGQGMIDEIGSNIGNIQGSFDQNMDRLSSDIKEFKALDCANHK